MFRSRRRRTCLVGPSEYACPSSFGNLQTYQHSNLPTFLQAIPFRIRTYKKHAYKPFRIRTYKTQDLKRLC